MNFFSKIKENPLLSALIFLLMLLAVGFVVVMFCEPKWIFDRLGIPEKEKNKALTFLGIGMGGILVALQALMSYKRARAMEDTAKAQANAANAQADAALAQARANENTEQGLRQERLKNAIEHLGHERDSVRMGGAYELFHLAEDSKNLRKTALDILCLHIRQTTGENEYQKKYKSKPSGEIQSLLTLLFVQDHAIFKDLQINLQESWLNGANLGKARLQRAILTGAHLQKANLFEAHLQGANLSRTHLQGTYLSSAYLQKAELNMAHLQGAALVGAHLQGAALVGAHLQGANLFEAHLQGAFLLESRLQEAVLREADVRGAKSRVWRFLTFAQCMRTSIGEETDLSNVIFAGGLTKEDVDSLVEGLSDEKANELRERLESHIGIPESNELPEGSNAITGAYTEEDAKKWIAEYEEAMSEVPEGDS